VVKFHDNFLQGGCHYFMGKSVHFRIRQPDVVHETIEGETVIINLANGNYYSTRGSGAEIWAMIDQGISFDSMVYALSQRYSTPSEEVSIGTRELIQLLQQEQLVETVIVETDTQPASQKFSTGAPGPGGAFAKPTLERYTDMQELLLLDPVHDVSEEGWPNLPETQA
jgi:hypothetical protein